MGFTVNADVDHMATLLKTYQIAKKKQAEHESQAASWKSNADSVKAVITAYLDEHKSNVGRINGRPAVKYTKFPKRVFEQKRFRQEHPDLFEEYSHEIEDSRFTPYGDAS